MKTPATLRAAPPSLAFAVIGQARADGTITPEKEGSLLAELLKHWAVRGSLETTASCAVHHQNQIARVRATRANYPARAVH
jgi:hypothetical protein